MEKGMPTETNEIRMSSGRFLSELIFRYAGVWMLTLCIISVIGLALGIVVDLRWFVAGLMLIFVVLPMLISFLYYYYGLRKECYVNTLRHKIRMEEEGLVITMRFRQNNDEEQNNEEESDRNAEKADTEKADTEIANTKIANTEVKAYDVQSSTWDEGTNLAEGNGFVVEKSEPGESEPIFIEREEKFLYSDLNPMRITSDSAMFTFRGNKKGFIWIPSNAFDDPENLAFFLETIDKKIEDAHT